MSKKYCPDCLVEVEDLLRHCPLCDAELIDDIPETQGEYPKSIPREEIVPIPSTGVKRSWTLLGLTVGGLLIMMTCTIVDLNINSQMGWSILVNLSILSVIFALGLIFYFPRRPIALFLGLWLVATLLTIAIDIAFKPISWAFDIAIPIAGLVLLFFGGWIYVIVRNRCRLVTSIVAFLTVTTMFCVAIDWTLNLDPIPKLSWSIPVLVSLSVISAVLLIAVKVIRKNTNFKRLFER